MNAPDLRYPFRLPYFATFPDAHELLQSGMCGGKYVYPPRIQAIHGGTFEVPGDFTSCVRPGMRVEKWKEGGFPLRTQEARAQAMVRRCDALLHLRGGDGAYFVIGVEHWCLYDPAASTTEPGTMPGGGFCSSM